jgi:acetyl esterase/lipase
MDRLFLVFKSLIHPSFLATVALLATPSFAQRVIPLEVPGAVAPATKTERQYFSKAWNTEVVSGVTQPSLTVYEPPPDVAAKGLGVVICPGGGFMALSINSEGIDVARWLSGRGVTAFVLKYRLAPVEGDATEEFQRLWTTDKVHLNALLQQAIPQAIADGHLALQYVKRHASEFGLTPDRVGIMGFSAGGTVTAGAAIQYSADSRPAFAAPIYAAASALQQPVPDDAPPLFIAAATDDNLGLGPDSVHLYELWAAAHKPVELHMYAKGGHGFGMRITGLPSAQWIDQFWEWLTLEGVLGK